ncbi:RNA polymerase sigma factor [Robertmurraya beringensis]|uniref:RNA polymerase sigma factor n=1 Tax=Robertmurraya beringensis TaxID=641660 RepID=A0ABV6KSH6_9BACI
MISNKISEWFYLYNKDIYYFLVYYIGSSDVEDLVQEVFIRAIKGYDTFQQKSSPKTWLFSIARHVGMDEMRKRKRVRMIQNFGSGKSKPKRKHRSSFSKKMKITGYCTRRSNH